MKKVAQMLDLHGMPACKVSDVKYVLVKVCDVNSVDNIKGTVMQYTRLIKTNVFIRKYECNGIVFMYADVDDVTMFDDCATKIVGSKLCSNSTYRYGDADEGFCFYSAMTTKWSDEINMSKITCYNEKETVTQKITQHHHQFIRPTEALSLISKIKRDKDGNKYVVLTTVFAELADMCRAINDVKATHASFILYFMAAKTWARKFIINLWFLCRQDIITFEKALKYEGVASKQMQSLYRNDMSQLYELNVLMNRLDKEVDWSKEKSNRVDINVTKHSYNEIHRAALYAFGCARGAGRKPRNMVWGDYWSTRFACTPNGAIHSDYGTDIAFIRAVKGNYRNKNTVVSSMPEYKHSHFIERRPAIVAKTSTKYEWGKVRALYGCDITSHLHADFGLMMCEDTLPDWMPVGARASEENVKALMSSMTTGVPFCYDYDDFNSQHSVSSMKAVIAAWISTFIDDLSPDQYESALWTMKSLDSMNVKHGTERWEVNGTLFSGWRLTSFINTVLNWAYLYVAGMNNEVMNSIHNGDDVYATVESVGNAVRIVRKAEAYGIRAQVSKMNIGTIAEFLRVDMRAADSTSAQYITRAVSTAVHGRIETQAPYSAHSAYTSVSTRCNEMAERGGNRKVVEAIKQIQIITLEKIFSTEKVFNQMDTINKTFGGLSDAVPDGRSVELLQTGTIDEEAIRTVNLMNKGITALQAYLAKKLRVEQRDVDYGILLKSAERSLNAWKETISIKHDNCVYEQSVMRSLKGAWSDAATDPINVLRQITRSIIGFRSFKDSGKAEVLSRAKNPLKWLQILL